MSAAELAAARAERAARFAAHQETATSQSPPAPPTAPLQAEVVAEAVAEAAVPVANLDAVLTGIELSGERDRVGTHRATEVDCRLWESAWKPVAAGSRVFTLNHGEGKLQDTRAETEVARARNIRFLTESARLIHQARSRGEAVWVHCTEVRTLPRQDAACRRADARHPQGINRGPAGLLAYLLLHTDVPSLHAAQRIVKRVRGKARTRSNTFALELEAICRTADKPLE